VAKAKKRSTAPRRARNRPPPSQQAESLDDLRAKLLGLIAARAARPRQGEEISISANFAGEGSQATSPQNWVEELTRWHLGSEPLRIAKHVIGAMNPLDPQRKSGRRGGRPTVFPEATIRAAQDDLRRQLGRHPHWGTGHAVSHAQAYLKLDKQQAKSHRRAIERTIVWPVMGVPKK
jgi:hypothetical protein